MMHRMTVRLLLLVGVGISNFLGGVEPNTFIASIAGFNGLSAIAITPNGLYAYVTNFGSNSVLVIDSNPSSSTFNMLVSAPGLVGVFNRPSSIAITPNGLFAYVTNRLGNNVSVIDLNPTHVTYNTVIDTIAGGFSRPDQIAITPDGHYAYVANANPIVGADVHVIDLTSNTVLLTPSLDGIVSDPLGIAITPNGNYVYIVDAGTGSVTVIDTRVNAPVPAPGLGFVNPFPSGIAITPNGLFAYVGDVSGTDVTFLDITLNEVASAPHLTSAFNQADAIAITPDGLYAYVANAELVSGTVSNVSVIDTNPLSSTYNSTLNTPGLIVPGVKGFGPLAITPDGQFVYVTNFFNDTVYVIYTGAIMAPTHVMSCKTQNRFLLQLDLINRISWSAPTSGAAPAAYAIYRDAALTVWIATVPATGPLVYDDHNRSPFVQDAYYVVSVGNAGNRSAPASTTPVAPC